MDDIIWYPVDDDAPQLPYPTQIQNAALTNVPWLFKVGEVYDAPKRFSAQRAKLGVPNGHVCGGEKDFTTGGEYQPSLPPVVYDEQGLPLCCHGPVVAKMGPQVRLELPDVAPEPRGCFCTEGKVGVVGVTYNEEMPMAACVPVAGLRTVFRTFSGLTPGATYHVEGIAHMIDGGGPGVSILDGVCGSFIGGGGIGTGFGDHPYHFAFVAPAGGVIQVNAFITGSTLGEYITDTVLPGP